MRLLLNIVACALSLGTARAQAPAVAERLSFNVAGAFERGAMVVGELRIPTANQERLPAVLIVNSSPGFDGRSASYAEALSQAGIATLEIDMSQGKGLPLTARHHLPHAYQSLQFLARHPRIDPARVGIMGFSWGGIISLLTSSDELTRQYSANGLRFAAHLALYPICWRHRAILAGKNSSLKPAVYRRVTGRPVHILVGDKDGYDVSDDCSKFVAELPAQVRPHYSVTLYPGATFAWDSLFGSAPYDASARGGKGGIVDIVADPTIAKRSREFAVGYFAKNLGAP